MGAVLIDITKCTGCEKCVEACRESNALGSDAHLPKSSSDGLSSRRLTTLLKLPEGHFARKQCVHCLQPACVEACLVGAIVKTSEGAVTYDPSKCIGCRYCMLACPLGVPRYEWDKPLPYMKKCDMCFERQQKGRPPACVEACPQEACLFGDRDDLLRVARQRIENQAGKYLLHIYGEKELGGTSVLYISDVPLDVLGWPENVGDHAIHHYTWPVLSKTPFLGLGTAALLTGLFWVSHRRTKLQKESEDNDRA